MPLKPLLGFEGVIRNGFQRVFLFAFEDYLELVHRTGRISREDKHGAINNKALPILERLNIDPDPWCVRATRFETTYQNYRQKRRRAARATPLPSEYYPLYLAGLAGALACLACSLIAEIGHIYTSALT
ncbi:hypothetical protein [Marinobacter maritimus]|uniref:hypothetical protein n=1 Tax=Marinobacter maritimus TaxID=277961 RepID=UPI001FE5A2BF|nr:hypothetical protein [Marinobacter maritimus]